MVRPQDVVIMRANAWLTVVFSGTFKIRACLQEASRDAHVLVEAHPMEAQPVAENLAKVFR